MYRFSDRIKDMNGTATREILKLTSRPEVISFAGGMPATQCLPVSEVREIAAELLSGEKASAILQYGQTEGRPELIEQIIKCMKDLGVSAQANNIQILSGGQQGLDLMFKAFINNGDVVLVEDPTYLAILQIARTYQARAVGVAADECGLVLSDLEAKLKKYSPKILYTVPTFSNPTGKTYTADNRKAIVELCDKYGTMIIEDDPYGRLRYDGEEVPLLKSFDKNGIVVYVSSFSKTISPGLRVAFAVGAPEVIRKVSIGKQGTDVHSPTLNQLIVAEYLSCGLYYKNIKANLAVYKERRDAMLAALKKYMPDCVRYTRPDGGLFIWVELPQYIDAKAMLPEAIEHNVAYIQGCEFFADGGGANTMRLNFSNSDIERIDRGISVIANIIHNKIKEHDNG